ncbi:MAG: hypothetical protein WEA04_05155 [Candidatus Andersenbacteria bacterium]
MSTSAQKLLLIISLVVINSLLHVFAKNNLVSFIPAPLVLATVLIWVLPAPLPYVFLLAIVSEVFSSLPFGLMALAILLPLFIFRLRKRIDVDLSFSFLALLGLTAIGQQLVMISADVVTFSQQGLSARALLDALPWFSLGLTIGGGTFVSFIECLMLYNLMPAILRPSHLLATSAYGRISY